mmetsp:Transcript_55114/g.175314  ORF Transcript_55114/g.175314 Transcript_55114/m.175314 type:complete len:99 (+) Transcript_55114:1324-1620(+)
MPSARLTRIRADRGESCVSACGRGGLRCQADQFWFINKCEILMKLFPCERGCSMVLGRDIPNYVMDPALSTHGQCLVTQEQPTCAAQHPGTARLCACV